MLSGGKWRLALWVLAARCNQMFLEMTSCPVRWSRAPCEIKTSLPVTANAVLITRPGWAELETLSFIDATVYRLSVWSTNGRWGVLETCVETVIMQFTETSPLTSKVYRSQWGFANYMLMYKATLSTAEVFLWSYCDRAITLLWSGIKQGRGKHRDRIDMQQMSTSPLYLITKSNQKGDCGLMRTPLPDSRPRLQPSTPWHHSPLLPTEIAFRYCYI